MFEAPTVQRQSRLTAALEEVAHVGADIDRRLDRLEAVILETLPQAAADDRRVRATFPAVGAAGPWTAARLKTLQREVDRVIGPLPYDETALRGHPQRSLLQAVSTVACLVGKKQQLRAVQGRVAQRAEALLRLVHEPTEDNRVMAEAHHTALKQERRGRLWAADVAQEALMRGHRNGGAATVTRPLKQSVCLAFKRDGALAKFRAEIQDQPAVWVGVFGNTYNPQNDNLWKLATDAASKVTLYDPAKAKAVGFQPMLVDQESGEELTTLGQLAQFVMKGLGVVRFSAVEPKPGAAAPAAAPSPPTPTAAAAAPSPPTPTAAAAAPSPPTPTAAAAPSPSTPTAAASSPPTPKAPSPSSTGPLPSAATAIAAVVDKLGVQGVDKNVIGEVQTALETGKISMEDLVTHMTIREMLINEEIEKQKASGDTMPKWEPNWKALRTEGIKRFLSRHQPVSTATTASVIPPGGTGVIPPGRPKGPPPGAKQPK